MEPHFFQLLDRIRYEAALSALCRDGKSLAVISPVQALAEHYKESLLERLPLEVPGVKIKAFFPADTDAIVQNFNKVVADMPLTQAMATPTADQAMEVWVVHDAAALPASEVMMMLDLLDKFPGAHVRALLVFAGTQIAPEGLESFDKSLMRWQIDRPSLDQIKDSLSRITDAPRLAQVRDLVSRMAQGKTLSAAVGTAASGGAMAAGSSSATASPTSGDVSGANRKPEVRTKRASHLKLLGVVAALLLLSTAVAAWLNPQAMSRLWGTPTEAPPATETKPSPEPESDKKAEPEAVPNATSDQKAEATPAAANVEQSSERGAEPKEQPKTQPSAATKAADSAATNPATAGVTTAAPTPSSPPVSTPAKADKSKSAIKDEAPIELPGTVLEGQKWASQFPRGTFVVQHAYADTFAKARDRLKRFPNLSEAKVVPQYEPGQSQAKFALISGPFESKELADVFLKNENMPKESWVRSSRAIQKRLTPTEAQPAKP